MDPVGLEPEVQVIDFDAPDAAEQLWRARNFIDVSEHPEVGEVGTVFLEGRVVAVLPLVRRS